MGSDEDYVYQLRRTGAAATYPNIKDVMKLKMGVTRFGRSTDNDYYLDSAKLKNFISRSHAEIHAKKSEDGQYVFVLHNKGLNGTFINDIKMNQFILLQEGDKITFGHTNGFKLEPGQRANQPNSEFEFVFEKVSARFAEADSTSEVRDGKILSSPESEHKKSPKSPKSPSKIKRQSDINTYLSKYAKEAEKLEIKSHESSVSPDRKSYDISSPEAKYSERSMSPLIPQPRKELSTLVMSEEEEEEEEKVEEPEVKKNFREPKSFNYAEDSDDDDDICDDDFKLTSIKTKGKRGRKKSPAKPKSPPRKTKGLLSPPSKTRDSRPSPDLDEELPSPGSVGSVSKQSDDNPYNFSDDSDNETKSKAKKPKGRPPGSKNKAPMGGPGKGRGRKAKNTPPQVEFDFPEDEPPPKKKKGTPTSNQGKKKKPVRQSSSASIDSFTEFDEPPQKKKRPGRQASAAESFSELEDGVEWYEEEKCAAEKCKRPKNKRVKWVQCDFCDEWYHTVCVGCQYENVKDNNVEFSCGYCH